jgi:hypothetical protein
MSFLGVTAETTENDRKLQRRSCFSDLIDVERRTGAFPNAILDAQRRVATLTGPLKRGNPHGFLFPTVTDLLL